jgi:hypothetical protein
MRRNRCERIFCVCLGGCGVSHKTADSYTTTHLSATLSNKEKGERNFSIMCGEKCNFIFVRVREVLLCGHGMNYA